LFLLFIFEKTIHMKRILSFLFILFITANVFSQTCEERNEKLLQAVGSFSAATLYNTYATIGSISDGFGKDVYDALTVGNLMDAQKKLMDNLAGVLNRLVEEKTAVTASDIHYCQNAVTILEGLKKQATLLDDYANTKRQNKLSEYDDQRRKNWSAISKLMGIAE